MLNSDSRSNISVTTGRWVTLRKVSGVTNSCADLVITTSTRTPSCVSLLASSTAL